MLGMGGQLTDTVNILVVGDNVRLFRHLKLSDNTVMPGWE